MMQRENIMVLKECSCQSDYSECNNGERISHIHIREHSRLCQYHEICQKKKEELFPVKGALRNMNTKCNAWSSNGFQIRTKKLKKGIIEQLEKFENGLYIWSVDWCSILRCENSTVIMQKNALVLRRYILKYIQVVLCLQPIFKQFNEEKKKKGK